MDEHGGGIRVRIVRRVELENSKGYFALWPLDEPAAPETEIRLDLTDPRKLTVSERDSDRAIQIFNKTNVALDAIARNNEVRGYEPIFKGTVRPLKADEQDNLEQLGALLAVSGEDPQAVGGCIPAAYTYIGQFIAHDLSQMKIEADDCRTNLVSSALDLSSLFGTRDAHQPDPRLSRTIPHGTGYDLFRTNGVPDIPDTRNDHNLGLSQVHVMLARFHDYICSHTGSKDETARQMTRNCFQYAVLHDYLPRIVGQEICEEVFHERLVLKPVTPEHPFLVPLEFALAFFRFGHGMVRDGYANFTQDLQTASLADLMVRTGKGGMKKGLEDTWVMPWHQMYGFGTADAHPNFGRRLGARVAFALSKLPAQFIEPPPNPYPPQGSPSTVSLPIKTLLSAATAGVAPAQLLAGELKSTLGVDRIGLLDFTDSEVRRRALVCASPALIEFLTAGKGEALLQHTPLWLYVLLEAQYYHDGRHLGPMAGRIVAETLYSAVASDEAGILGKSCGFAPKSAGLSLVETETWFMAMTRAANLM